MADYGKQKSQKPQRSGPPHREHNAPGGPANPFGARPDKAALVERMKEAARKAQPEGAPDGAPDDAPDGVPVPDARGENGD